ncbi:hypothetical protein SteCoe_30575 [Stentor coeruleus]|uniref:AIG1-type G domain-containing protein n=1 Tax=Stentor coeruleus TaxID=5963 RepID=A0A1R2B3A2_9CILI|nr:hypothetical protein SteCoe_30575 [Stentor coeruleus]
MATRLVLVSGGSQVGKSSTINTLIGRPVARVGGYGISETLHVTFYEADNSLSLFPNDPQTTKLILIDVPGFRDSHLRISDDEISEIISKKIFELGQEKLDGILLFESASAPSIQILPNLNSLMRVFGSEIGKSIIIVTTKWDKLLLREKNKRRDAYIKFREFLFVEWINDNEDFMLENQFKEEQLRNLANGLRERQPFKLNGIERLKEECLNLAKTLHKKDFVNKTIEYTEQVPVETIEKENYTEYVNAYTDESSIRSRAYELQRQDGTHSVSNTRSVTKYYQEPYTVIEKRPRQVTQTHRKWFLMFEWVSHVETFTVYDEVSVTKYRDVPRQERETYYTYEYYPVENYLSKARNEQKKVTKQRDKKVTKIVTEKKFKEIKIERFSLSHYYPEAQKKMAKQFEEECKRYIIR